LIGSFSSTATGAGYRRRIGYEPLTLRTSDGLALDADLLRPVGDVGCAVVICHPHPRFGGDRHDAVVGAIAQACGQAGIAALRFDFRGVGRSEGTHGGGVAERLDVVAALDALTVELPGVQLQLVGYSFGAAVALDVDDGRVAGWVAVAPPLAVVPGEPAAARDRRPVHLLVPRHDQFTPPDVVDELVRGWVATTVTVVESADHFLAGHLASVAHLTVTTLLASPGFT